MNKKPTKKELENKLEEFIKIKNENLSKIKDPTTSYLDVQGMIRGVKVFEKKIQETLNEIQRNEHV
tara:strand:- start:1745 stop:1942 length:198 start_codon:yes stop_codon:yes gene_type:complete